MTRRHTSVCLSIQCKTRIPCRKIFCPYHWNAIAPNLRLALAEEYEADSLENPSDSFQLALMRCVHAVALKENILDYDSAMREEARLHRKIIRTSAGG